jgi:hypothetical protein
MLVSHESPLALLDKSRAYNDYDYCLVHLLDQYPQYHDFFVKSKQMGRRVLLDNSMFELREAFEASKFAEWVNKLQPDEFIVPDVFNDSVKTMQSFEQWLHRFSDIRGRRIGVVQGTTYQEMVDCYLFMASNADKIAISFESAYFHSTGYSLESTATIWHRLMNGRQEFIKDLIRDGVWAWSKPHHLLGCTLPQEFKAYAMPNLESIDTSNPVVAGMHNVRYNNHGLDDKIPAKLADLLDHPVTDENWEVISYNIASFREINHI